jgi:hypothetical protein
MFPTSNRFYEKSRVFFGLMAFYNFLAAKNSE